MRLIHVCYQCKVEWEVEGVPTKKDLCPTCSPVFQGFKKIPRLSRDIIITEKIDGTNGLIYIDENNNIFAGSRKRWLWNSIQDEIHNDNHGFAQWVKEEKKELLKLGKGYHYGEWWGKGIQRGYGLEEKRFSLFNVSRWIDGIELEKTLSPEYHGMYLAEKQKINKNIEFCPECCYVVPILYEGRWTEYTPSTVIYIIDEQLEMLKISGSIASPGFMKPEGIVIYHTAGNYYFKKTIENDEKWKNSNE